MLKSFLLIVNHLSKGFEGLLLQEGVAEWDSHLIQSKGDKHVLSPSLHGLVFGQLLMHKADLVIALFHDPESSSLLSPRV